MPDENNQVVSNDTAAGVAFDVKDLEARLLSVGLGQVEGLARTIVETVFAWTEDSIKASPSKYDDLALALTGPLKNFLLAKIDQIAAK